MVVSGYDRPVILKPVDSSRFADSAPSINLRCPACRHDAAFEPLVGADTAIDVGGRRHTAGQRRCGNPECRAHLFVVFGGSGRVLTTYPPETIDFDASDLPARVVEAFEEAVKCHAQQCFIASAIMVRKTLEEICADRGATGQNLKQRIEALGTSVVLPQALLDGLDDLRLLGNDAAHLESRVYEKVGADELQVAIDVAKEILKATYQYEGLMRRLRALQKTESAE
jgi:hypothetical protein